MPPRKKTQATPANLESVLWDAANKLRNNMDAAEYKHVVLGLIFLKYVSDVFDRRRRELDALIRDEASDYFMPTDAARAVILESRDEYTSEGVFWIPEGHRWSDLRAAAKQPDIGARIDVAMDAIEKENPTLKGVLPKNYARRELTPAMLGGLIDMFSRDDLAAAENDDLDVLGRVYEYFLGKFASAEGKLGGEFYTPRPIVAADGGDARTVQRPRLRPGLRVGRHVRSGRPVRARPRRAPQRHLRLRPGAEPHHLAAGQDEPRPARHRRQPRPPMGRLVPRRPAPRPARRLHPGQPPIQHLRLGRRSTSRRPPLGLRHPPAGNANFAWLQHMLHHLAPTGTMATVLANGSLSVQQSGEGDIRKNLVEADLVECIVALPSQLFYTTGIPVCLWFLTKDKAGPAPSKPNARTRPSGRSAVHRRPPIGHMVDRTLRELTADDIARIADTYHSWRGEPDVRRYEDVPGFCASATLDHHRRTRLRPHPRPLRRRRRHRRRRRTTRPEDRATSRFHRRIS